MAKTKSFFHKNPNETQRNFQVLAKRGFALLIPCLDSILIWKVIYPILVKCRNIRYENI